MLTNDAYPVPAGWTVELESNGYRFLRSVDGKHIGRQDGTIVRFESTASAWDTIGRALKVAALAKLSN